MDGGQRAADLPKSRHDREVKYSQQEGAGAPGPVIIYVLITVAGIIQKIG